MKNLLKFALASAFATVLVRWVARQWSTEGSHSDEIPTVNPAQDSEASVVETMEGDDQRLAPKWPF